MKIKYKEVYTFLQQLRKYLVHTSTATFTTTEFNSWYGRLEKIIDLIIKKNGKNKKDTTNKRD